MTMVTGTFAATGQSAPIEGRVVSFHCQFAGAATVLIEWFVAGAWRTAPGQDITTGTFAYIYHGPKKGFRLNCTAFTAAVAYEMSAE